MSETKQPGHIVCSGEGVNMYRLLTYRQGLKIEARGMRLTRGRSVTATLKERYGLPRNAKRERVSEMLEAEIEACRAELQPGDIEVG